MNDNEQRKPPEVLGQLAAMLGNMIADVVIPMTHANGHANELNFAEMCYVSAMSLAGNIRGMLLAAQLDPVSKSIIERDVIAMITGSREQQSN